MADESRPFTRGRTFVLDSSNSVAVVDDIYYQGDGYSLLSIELSCEPGTALKKIACGGEAKNDGFGDSNLLESDTGWDKTGTIFFQNKYFAPIALMRMCGLSVDFTAGGVLTYYPNTNTLNQD